MPKTAFKIVTTTVARKADATRLASAIMEAGLAACIQLWPIHSTYRWQGKIESSREFVLSCKTRLSRVRSLCGFIKANHTYELPEIVVTSIESGSSAYLAWIERETIGPQLTFSPATTTKSGLRNA